MSNPALAWGAAALVAGLLLTALIDDVSGAELYQTPHFGELRTKIRATNGAFCTRRPERSTQCPPEAWIWPEAWEFDPYSDGRWRHRDVYKLRFHMNEGDIAQVSAKVQVTNDSNVNMSFSCQLTWETRDYFYFGREEGGDKDYIPPAWNAGTNVHPRYSHHHWHVATGAFQAYRDDDYLIRMTCWAKGSRVQRGDYISIDQGQGGLSVIVHKSDDA